MFTPFDRFLVLDTETANDLDCPFAYDVGWAIVDKFGNVYATRSFVVAEIFNDTELMTSAYYAKKLPRYFEEIANGSRMLASYATVKRTLRDDMRAFGVKIVVAHNARFDYRSTNYTQRYLTCSKYRYFFPYGTEIWDTLKMAREVLRHNDEYRTFCETHGYICKNGQLRYTAEVLHRFLSGDLDFEESHTGLEDVLIEKDIFAYCIGQNAEIDGRLWKN